MNESHSKTSESNELSSIAQLDAAYTEADLDRSICAQIEASLARNKKAHIKLQKNLKNIQDDINLAQSEISKLEVELDTLLTNFDGGEKSSERQIKRLEMQIELKMKLLETLRKREDVCWRMLESKEEHVQPTVSSNDGAPTHILNVTKHEITATRRSKPVSVMTSYAPSNKRHFQELMENDDADLKAFIHRVRAFQKEDLCKHYLELEQNGAFEEHEDHPIDDSLRVPGKIWRRLYEYQREGVSWLWGLHQHGVGGILGDEMGLGKTIQIIAFLAALRHSRCSTSGGSFEVALSLAKRSRPSSGIEGQSILGPVLIVCPGTVLKQWLAEFRSWIPTARVVIIHSSGSGYGNVSKLVDSLFETSGFALTTYGTLTQHRDLLLPLPWHYLVLDEGHKIKNPEAEITSTVKRVLTPHKLIVSGTPMQNNLKELWSVFDFVYPGKLGGLSDFLINFAVPITQGGYANSTPMQVETAYRCACTLKNLLSPYLLRRLKSEVSLELPRKSEQVLFCHLTDYQRSIYEEYLSSQACQDILRGNGLVFKGLILLKALCNHPDLVTGGPRRFGVRFGEDQEDFLSRGSKRNAVEMEPWQKFGCSRRSGKLMVTLDLLALWRDQQHKVLIFSQSRRMLRLLEKHLIRLDYSYMRMDGTTAVGVRQSLVDRFNTTSSRDCFVFLLTTRVGGLGINLTGANRVLIYDPDWNPSTDAQAKERAWRIGQSRDVVIYRLLTSGAIEEKIYQRQIFKQFLTNRVLNNPRQQRFFKINDLQELFSLAGKKPSEASSVQRIESLSFFKNVGVPKNSITQPIQLAPSLDNRFDRLFAQKDFKINEDSDIEGGDDGVEEEDPDLKVISGHRKRKKSLLEETPEERETRLREQARRLSQKLTKKYGETRRHKQGTRVDGQRIRGVVRRSRFDEGEGREEDTRKLPRMDSFLASVLGGGEEIETRIAGIQLKRQQVDGDMRQEAIRVAETALAGIQRKVGRTEAPLKQSQPSSSRPRNLIALQSAVQRLQKLTVVNHDRLMKDFLMSERSLDPSLGRLQAARLASSVVNWLNAKARQVGGLYVGSTEAAPLSPIFTQFGLVKNGFLWSPSEHNSPLYLSYKSQRGPESASAGPGEPSSNLFYSGHNRLGSSLLLELIRQRRNSSLNFLGISLFKNSSSGVEPPGTASLREVALRRIAIDLLLLFREDHSPSTSSNEVVLSTTTSAIAERFERVLASRSSSDSSDGLDAGHFRALLRSVASSANPSNKSSSQDPSRKKRRRDDDAVWKLKPAIVVVARRLALMPDKFNADT